MPARPLMYVHNKLMKKDSDHRSQAIIMFGWTETGITIVNQGLTIVVMAFGRCHIVGVDISLVIGEIIAEDTIGTKGVGDN